PQPLRLPLIDLSGLPAANREIALLKRLNREGHIAFDLTTGPLWWAGLYRMAPERHALLINLHHIIADAWSLEVLCRELQALYQHGLRGAALELEPLPIQ